MRRASRTLTSLLVITILLGAIVVDAEQEGITSVPTGCLCHSNAPTFGVVVNLSGLPQEYIPSVEYSLVVSVSGGPDPYSSGTNAQGGFNLVASGGEFRSIDLNTTSHGMEATHSELGNDQREWTIIWVAPDDSDEILFKLHGNSVNGDGNASVDDRWNRVDVIIQGTPPSDEDRGLPGFSFISSLAVLFSLAILMNHYGKPSLTVGNFPVGDDNNSSSAKHDDAEIDESEA